VVSADVEMQIEYSLGTWGSADQGGVRCVRRRETAFSNACRTSGKAFQSAMARLGLPPFVLELHKLGSHGEK